MWNSLIRLLKPLVLLSRKNGMHFYGVNKMYFDDGKAAYRGQDGAGFASIK